VTTDGPFRQEPNSATAHEAFKAGNLYVMHSSANPGGEMRGQIKP
jgi:hypothetical protein